jgi:hypothetical protein
MDFGLDKGAVQEINSDVKCTYSPMILQPKQLLCLVENTRGINSIQTSKERIHYEQPSSNPTTTKNL